MNRGEKKDLSPAVVNGGNNSDSGVVGEDLKEIKSTMHEMMHVMKHMQGEITRLTKKCNGMEKSIQKVHNKLDTTYEEVDLKDRLNYLEVLLENQKWTYSAPRPSEDYWYNIEYDVDEEEAAEDFLQQIENKTKELRYGTSSVTSNKKSYSGDIEITATPLYDEEFYPHWKEFASALREHQYYLTRFEEHECTFRLSGMAIPDRVIDLLSNALEDTHFHHFILEDNSLTKHGVHFALTYLQTNHIIKEFNIKDNPIQNMKDVKRLCRIISKHPSLETLGLDGCNPTGEMNFYQVLRSMLKIGKNNNIDSVHLSRNHIRTRGGTFISNFLASNPVLLNLYLTGNQLDDNDALAIASALKHNTNLLSLGLQNNNFTINGWMALCKAVFDDTSLNSAADSNHTCCIDFPSDFEYIEEMNGDQESETPFDSMHVRQKKIYSILSSRNNECSNVKHFDNVPVELLPDMLVSFQQYSDYHVPEDTPNQSDHDVQSLSLVYEICRHWDECLSLYESLSS